MATKPKAKKTKATRGGTNQPPHEPIPVKAGANGHTGTVGEAVDLVVERAKEAAGEGDKPVDPPDSPERLAKWDRDTIKLVQKAEIECGAAEAILNDAAEEHKAAKKKFDLAVADLRHLIRERKSGRGKPVQGDLYDKTDGHAAGDPDLRQPGEVPATDDDSWKKVPLTELVDKHGLPVKIADLLATGERKGSMTAWPIVTLGDLVKYQEPEESGYTKRLIDISGIGPAKIEEIDKATESFWKSWRPHAPEPQGAAETPAPDPKQPGDQPGDPPADGKPASGEPAGYHTDGVDRIAKRKRQTQGQ